MFVYKCPWNSAYGSEYGLFNVYAIPTPNKEKQIYTIWLGLFKHSKSTERKKPNYILLKMSDAIRKHKLNALRGF
jgi:hypothetical protein